MFSALLKRRHAPSKDDTCYPVVVDPLDDFATLARIGGYSIRKSDRNLKGGAAFPFPLHEGRMYVAECEILQLADPYQCVDFPKALAKLDKMGYRPASAHEFLCFLAQHPRKNRGKADLYALGAVHTDEHGRVHVLGVFDREREYSLQVQWNHGCGFWSAWLEYQRFLAVPKRPDAVYEIV
jgi:hypothetical protein